jgi:hypothetical protein
MTAAPPHVIFGTGAIGLAPPLTRGKLVVLIHPDTPGTLDSRSTP